MKTKRGEEEVFELPIKCFEIRNAMYDIESEDKEYNSIEFKTVELTTKSIKDARVDLVIKEIELFLEDNEAIESYHNNKSQFYHKGFYDRVNEVLYDITEEEGKAPTKKLRRDINLFNQLNKRN